MVKRLIPTGNRGDITMSLTPTSRYRGHSDVPLAGRMWSRNPCFPDTASRLLPDVYVSPLLTDAIGAFVHVSLEARFTPVCAAKDVVEYRLAMENPEIGL